MVLDDDQCAAFLTNLYEFAYDNELTDLKVAYRLMDAEAYLTLPAGCRTSAILFSSALASASRRENQEPPQTW